MTTKRKPLVGVICDRKIIDPHPYHVAGEKYLTALASAAGVTPVLIPAFGNSMDIREWLEHLDGLFLTGAYSMVQPSLYNAEQPEGMEIDIDRDSTSIQAIRVALSAGIPLLGVCRGFQELVVATGGTLNQKIYEDDRFHDHRENKSLSIDGQYGKSHTVDFPKNSKLAAICDCESSTVNSLHVQGAESLGQGVQVEALADDGLVEAISVLDSPSFALAVQWHPEWKVQEDDVSRKIFAAFGEACRKTN